MTYATVVRVTIGLGTAGGGTLLGDDVDSPPFFAPFKTPSVPFLPEVTMPCVVISVLERNFVLGTMLHFY